MKRRSSGARGAAYVEVLVIVGVVVTLGLAAVLTLGDGMKTKGEQQAHCISTFDCAGGGSAPAAPLAGVVGPTAPAAAAPPQTLGSGTATGVLEKRDALYWTTHVVGGVADGLWQTVRGTAELAYWVSPIGQAQGLYQGSNPVIDGLTNVVLHPIATAQAIGGAVRQSWHDDPAYTVGRGVFEVAAALTPAVAARAGTVARAGEVADAARVAEAARIAEAERVAEAARIAEATRVAEAVRIVEADRAAAAAAAARYAAGGVRADLDAAVQAMFNGGPNRWSSLPTRPQGAIWTRGVSGDYSTAANGVNESMAWLRGEASTTERFVSTPGSEADVTRFVDEVNRQYASPLMLRGRSPSLLDPTGRMASLPRGTTIDSAEAIGMFPGTSNPFDWVRGYQRVRTQVLESGMPLSTTGRGAEFERDLQRALSRSVWRDTELGRALQNEDEVNRALREVFERYR